MNSEITHPVHGDAFASKILRRPITTFTNEELGKAIKGRSVVITGAGGFIGAGLVRMVAALDPAAITLIERSEKALYEIDRYLDENWSAIPRQAEYCDIRDAVALESVFSIAKPDIVFNAAALKHVPLLQDHPREAALTNALAVRTVASMASKHKVRLVVSVSTDKAVNSTSTMGRSKRLAEQYLRAIDVDSDCTRFASVRFGNVFGSSGSVVPLFDRQIRQGGPVTVTDNRMTRYFMTLSEAASFLLVVAGMFEQRIVPRSPLFILDMGEPVPISEIAERMVAFEGDNDTEVAIAQIGRRPGEKLFEDLVADGEELGPSGRDGIGLLSGHAEPFLAMTQLFDALQSACDDGDQQAILNLLHSDCGGTTRMIHPRRSA